MYNMRINKKSEVISADGSYIITREAINKVRKPNIFIEDTLNYWVKANIQEVLKLAMLRDDNYKYGEVGILLDFESQERYIFYGSNSNVKIDDNIVINYERSINKFRQCIFIHNHPNNSSFSKRDIKNFIVNDYLNCIIAVTNKGDVYILSKNINFDRLKGDEYIKNKKSNLLRDIDTINIKYTKLFRKEQ